MCVYVSLCTSACCLCHLHIQGLFVFTEPQCYCFFWGGKGVVSGDDSLFKKYYFFLFDLAFCLQLSRRNLDSLVMAGIQVLSLSVFGACSELCQSRSTFDLSSARMVAPYSICVPSASEAAFPNQII